MAEVIKGTTEEKLIVYSNRIDEELHTFFMRFMPEDDAADLVKVDAAITAATQGRFNAAMMHCGKTIFGDRKGLKAAPYMTTPGTTIYTNNGSFDYDLLYGILDYYIYLCSVYDKEVSSYGYCYLINVDQSVYTFWLHSQDGNPNYGSNPRGLKLAQKIKSANEGSLSDILTSGKRNPVAILGALNHRHGWNMPGVRDQAPRRQALPAAELPRLTGAAGPDVVQSAQDDGPPDVVIQSD
jgi:hypothetical protein